MSTSQGVPVLMEGASRGSHWRLGTTGLLLTLLLAAAALGPHHPLTLRGPSQPLQLFSQKASGEPLEVANSHCLEVALC